MVCFRKTGKSASKIIFASTYKNKGNNQTPLPCLSHYREKTFSLTIKFITHNETFNQRFAHTLPHMAVNAPQLLRYDI